MKNTIDKKKNYMKEELRNFILNNQESINRISIKKYEDTNDIFIKKIKTFNKNKVSGK